MAQLLQTPKRVNITVADDATALEAVKRLVTGHETKVQIVPSESPHRCVEWNGNHVLVRLHKPLRGGQHELELSTAVGPKILGTFVNGHVEEYYVYHTPAKVHEKPDAIDGLARALAAVHALKCDADKPRSWVMLRRACENARTLSFGERGHLVKTRYKDVSPILDSSLLVRNLDQLEARVPPKAVICLCHGAAAAPRARESPAMIFARALRGWIASQKGGRIEANELAEFYWTLAARGPVTKEAISNLGGPLKLLRPVAAAEGLRIVERTNGQHAIEVVDPTARAAPRRSRLSAAAARSPPS